jgi:signal transduction histidine kinase
MQKLGTTITRIVRRFEATEGIAGAQEIIDQINSVSERQYVQIVFLDGEGLNRPRVPLQELQFQTNVLSLPRTDEEGIEHMYTYVRYSSVTARPTALELSEPIHHTKQNSTFFALHALIVMGATTLLGAVLVVALGSAWIGRPLRQLIDKTRRIGQGDLSGPLAIKRRDEFGELAQALNSMCDQLQQAQDKIQDEAEARIAAQTQLRHVDRLRTVGRLAAGIAHELGTPLNVISGRANLIASGQLDGPQTRESAEAIKSEADRIAKIIRQLLDFARRSSPQRRQTDLVQLSRQTVELLTPIAKKNGAQLLIGSVPDACSLEVDPGQIQQVITNLLVNAFQATGADGRVELTIDRQAAKPPEGVDATHGQYVRIQVRDNGSGIPDDIHDQLFEPFFTTKQVGQGTGLGLSIAYGIVQDHGGWIDFTTNPGKGSEFSVYLPTEVAACQDES